MLGFVVVIHIFEEIKQPCVQLTVCVRWRARVCVCACVAVLALTMVVVSLSRHHNRLCAILSETCELGGGFPASAVIGTVDNPTDLRTNDINRRCGWFVFSFSAFPSSFLPHLFCPSHFVSMLPDFPNQFSA
jgi:hypothetical protein